MNISNRKNTNPVVTGTAVPRLGVVCVLLMLVAGCTTIGGEISEARKTIKQTCSAVVAQQNAQAQKPGENKGDCLPKGVIEIADNVGVDPETREQFDRAIDLLVKEKYPEAIRLLRAVTGKTSKFTAPYINLGIAYARIGEMKKAEENLQKALQINNKHPVASNELGLVYRKTGRYQEARKLYESLLKVYPDFLPARKNLGVLCDIYIQDLDCAHEQYQVYLKGLPDDEKVKIWVADVKSRM
jgi:tetratricopeptide (TPR) repeat protein